jgi:thiol-disulfide isomerase/thioredoxin
MQKFKRILVPFAMLVLLAALVFILSQNKQAPIASFTTIEGKKINMADLKGKVVLVNFWATDCEVCVGEMPDLVKTYNAYKNKGFEVIAVAMPYDPPAQVLNYATQKKLPFPVMHDGFGDIAKTFGNVQATPTAYLFDKNGKQLFYKTGALDFTNLNQLLDKVLI